MKILELLLGIFLFSNILIAEPIAQNNIYKTSPEQNKIDKSNFFRKAPYILYAGKNTKMLILWQLNTTKNCTLSWGTDSNYTTGSISSSEYGNDHQHKYLLQSLIPNTKYYFKVEVDNQNIRKGNFRSGAADNDKKISFYAYGDTRSNPSKHNLVAQAIMTSIAQDSLSQTFIVSSGDFVSNGNNESDWDNQFFAPQYTSIQKMLSSLPYLASMGNHEGQGILYDKYFPFPMYTTNRYYYSFDYGPVHFTVIDQFTNYSNGSAQYNWIVNDLASTNKEWKIILLHEPGWSAGGHYNNYTVQNVIQPLCINYGVQFVITGHNHYYARALVNGVEHITTGGGGAPLYNPHANAQNIVKTDKSYHFCKIDIDHDTLHFSAIRANGSLIETFDYHRTPNSINLNLAKTVKSIKIYSFDKNIVIDNPQNHHGNIEIYNLTGNIIYTKELSSGKQKILIPNGGIYFVRVTVGNTFFVDKLLL